MKIKTELPRSLLIAFLIVIPLKVFFLNNFIQNVVKFRILKFLSISFSSKEIMILLCLTKS